MHCAERRYEESGFRQAIYNETLPDGSVYRPPGATATRWRAYQANELCHAAMASLFNGLMRMQANDYLTGVQPGELVSAFASSLAPALKHSTQTWRAWATGDIGDWIGLEQDLADSIAPCLSGEPKGADDTAALAEAVRLLAILWGRWGSGQGGVTGVVSHYAGPGSRSLSAVLSTLSATQDAPVTDAVAAVCRRHIIGDHLAIAGRKLVTTGRDTYHFTVADGLLADGKWRAYDYTSPRLNNLARFLADARLLEGHQPTQDGIAFLKEYQAA